MTTTPISDAVNNLDSVSTEHPQVLDSKECNAVPPNLEQPVLLTYRACGIGLFGVGMRFLGMPLEKIALFLNSSQVQHGSSSVLRQALQLTFPNGNLLAPYRVVGPASLRAWFLQYSVMGFCFQGVDHGLSHLLQVRPVYYGAELMEEAKPSTDPTSWNDAAKSSLKLLVAPLLSAALETQVSNRAEVQRYFGKEQMAQIESTMLRSQRGNISSFLRSSAGPAFSPCFMRNFIMCQTTFVLTPVTYKLYFPQEHKTPTSLFWYGLAMNVFVGNGIAITQQALWGRSLDYLAKNGRIDYRAILQEAWAKEGRQAFFTAPKWSSRVMMNAPAQGVLPWFYNEVLPLGEGTVKSLLRRCYSIASEVPQSQPQIQQHSQTHPTQPLATCSNRRRDSEKG